MSSTHQPAEFRRRWWIANGVGFSLAYGIYSFIAHGITGAHGDALTAAQVVAHVSAHLTVAVLVLSAQSLALHGRVTGRTRIALGAVLYSVVWEVAYRVLGPPADYGLGFLVLGSAMWLGTSLARSTGAWRSAVAVLSFCLGIPAGYLVLDVLYRLGIFTIDFSSLLQHWMFFQVIGIATGTVGGFVSSRLLRPSPTS